MASGNPGTIAGVGPVMPVPGGSGNISPPGGKPAPATAASAAARPVSTGPVVSNDPQSAAAPQSDPQSLVDQANKYLNDSGLPDQFRVDPDSASYIQQVNPATGAVVAQYLASEFPALARSVGASGLLIDDTA